MTRRLALALLLSACASPAPAPSSAPAPAPSSAPAPSAPAPSAPPPPPTLATAVEFPLDAFARAVLGTPDAVGADLDATVLADYVRGPDTYALVRVDLEAELLARLEARDGADAAAALEADLLDVASLDGRDARFARAQALLAPTQLAGTDDVAGGIAEGRAACRFELVHTRRTVGVVELVGRATVVPFGLAADADEELGCTTRTELRARDVDTDGAIELVAIVVYALEDSDEEGTTETVCAARAAVLDARDLHVQLALVRERRARREDVWSETDQALDRPFRFEDTDADGHVDVVVTETTRNLDYAAPDDCDPDEEPTPASTTRSGGRQRWICPYEPASDRWACPEDVRLD